MKTRNDCRDWRELLGVYALGQLGGDERAGLEAHLEGCAQCREELALLEPVARMLPHADPERFESAAPQPPPELGARIAATIAGERQQVEQRRRRRVFGGFALGGATAALAAAVLAIFVLGGGGGGEPAQHVKFASQGVSIDATLEPHSYGTEIRMYVHGVESGTLCRVSLRGPGGVSYPAGTFRYRAGEDSEAVLSSALDLSRTRAVVVHAGKRIFVAPLGRAPIALNTQSEEEST
ncbi:MAG TPA: anti-sigma factor [Solirubrobacterales bacterium]|nr:anti-sigma factor [Solirubrobacterales bacterium]